MLSPAAHAEYIFKFIDTYREYEHADILLRECMCTRVKIQYAFKPIESGDLFAGRYQGLAVGFGPQESGFGYFLNTYAYDRIYKEVAPAVQEKLNAYMEYWKPRVSANKLRAAFPEDVAAVVGSDRYYGEPGVAFYLNRISGTHPDYEKLVRLGIDGLCQEIAAKREAFVTDSKEYRTCSAMIDSLSIFTTLCENYADSARADGHEDIAVTVRRIAHSAPGALREAIQLVHLYALLCGSYNYGRMDQYLGNFLPCPDALDYLCGFWRLINARGNVWNNRIIVGGRGRTNEALADQFALLAMEASRLTNDVLPQLTLRFYKGQNPALLQKAYDNFAQGIVYPMLYNDEVNIPSVRNAFGVDLETAAEYLPFGCGEYILNHRSLGTPNGVINLLKALEDVLFDCDYETFVDLFAAYQGYVEKHVDALGVIERLEFDVAAKEAGFLLLAVLFDDCIAGGKPLIEGVRYLGGTLESYGNTNTADSLTAIQETVYDKQLFTLQQLKEMLLANFEGYEKERQVLLSCPKYGNDSEAADEMAVAVHTHLCNYTRSLAPKIGLATYLIVIINNDTNVSMGSFTRASADGRLAGAAMANANNPMAGMDKEGVTAFLNSLVKLDTAIHAGATQNMKFSKELLRDHRPAFEALLQTYFDNGGQQAMLNILSKGDLEDALIHPEKYPNLIVRVGGFCARFIELGRATQLEIIQRTMH